MAWFDSLRVSAAGGRLGLCACPGLERTLAADLEALHDWGAMGLLSLIEQHELEMVGIQSLPAELKALRMRWWHMPIRDMSIPDDRFETDWRETGRELRELLDEGASIAVHCMGGRGRTGTIAARLLVELGSEPEIAIARVREVRPGAIETRGQEAFVYACGAIC